MSYFFTPDGGLTSLGTLLGAILIFSILVVIALKKHGKSHWDTRRLAFSAMAIAIATVLSMVKLYRLPMGGSVTAFSMLFASLVGWFYGPVEGLLVGVAYGLLQMLLGPYVISLPQLILDYVLSFGALGITGFFCNQKNGLPIGYLAAVFGRFFFSVLSGIVFFAEYAPEGVSPLIYSLGYNAGYLFAEAAITLILILLPPVKKALLAVKQQANA